MRTGAAAGHPGYYHEALLYDSDDELLAVVLPFLRDGVAAGEPSMVSLGERNTALVRSALPAGSGVTFLDGGGVYARPTAAIRSYRRLLADHAAAGAAQIRIVGELPPVAFGRSWDWWARYESAINHAYDEFPLWSMCPYDTRTTPPEILADVARTHPRTATADGRHLPNEAYTEPETYLREPRPVPPDPLQRGAALVELGDPTPAQARAAVHAVATAHLTADEVEDLSVAVSEAVTNALRHGLPPVRFRLWAGGGRVVVTVSDAGKGPSDPYAGLLPAPGATPGGLGLWITHQSCDHVAMQRGPDGFTLRLTTGDPNLAG
ncbi:anti-sigma factor RsbA family regulatory protein [Micromonospora halophytica]|uniref:Anti-sigma regulatory factor (Ser/Thr protein kinase) n=1 Tax=Micromonospora halophytica TaxID=47864 RepID=A0A1C5JEU0_9ACTN|nr:anti-sigma factor RsbA family regulatory protein [Micromonospora halophytica]SCG69043.1 Anti-sigma regulatory factor (Ser/Thr protein kinase) [Micromonospora halophytica]